MYCKMCCAILVFIRWEGPICFGHRRGRLKKGPGFFHRFVISKSWDQLPTPATTQKVRNLLMMSWKKDLFRGRIIFCYPDGHKSSGSGFSKNTRPKQRDLAETKNSFRFSLTTRWTIIQLSFFMTCIGSSG